MAAVKYSFTNINQMAALIYISTRRHNTMSKIIQLVCDFSGTNSAQSDGILNKQLLFLSNLTFTFCGISCSG